MLICLFCGVKRLFRFLLRIGFVFVGVYLMCGLVWVGVLVVFVEEWIGVGDGCFVGVVFVLLVDVWMGMGDGVFGLVVGCGIVLLLFVVVFLVVWCVFGVGVLVLGVGICFEGVGRFLNRLFRCELGLCWGVVLLWLDIVRCVFCWVRWWFWLGFWCFFLC